MENECMRNACRRKALYQWCPTCSHIKLHTIQQAIIFVCFFCSQVSAHSSGAVHCVNTPRDPSFLSKQAMMLLSPSYSQALQNGPGLMGCCPPPPVPLELLEARALKKSEYLKMDLKRNPGEVMSEMYSINIPYFSHGLSYEWIQFLKTFEKVVKGQNLMSTTSKFTMMRMLLQGDALHVFESKATGPTGDSRQLYCLQECCQSSCVPSSCSSLTETIHALLHAQAAFLKNAQVRCYCHQMT